MPRIIILAMVMIFSTLPVKAVPRILTRMNMMLTKVVIIRAGAL